ncbi:degenerin unc-8-like [Mizuhopecten yessoensis]|uniref:degenerin unc-8-like n=1 Tax=Mizuhopecten yessoensis TaxID=6573 RepID=UPI000B45C55D|nr:degenerin unc-8-like [Mizuhopecten yessoensis]
MRGNKNVTDMFTKLRPVDTKMIHNIKVSPRPIKKRSLSGTLKSIQTIKQAATNVSKENRDANKETVGTILRSMGEQSSVHGFRNGTSGLAVGQQTFDDFLASMRNTSNTVYDTASFEIRITDIDEDVINQVMTDAGDDSSEELDELYILNQRLQQEYESLSRDDRISMGHDIDKMLLSCTFAGRQCKRPTRRHVSKEYGNCYTFESKSYVATRSGPDYGFQMTLNLETHEAIPHMTHGYGARIVLHQSGSFPLPAEEGMTLSPGYETSLGVRMAKISRLGPPHGSCAIPLGFFGKRGYNNISSSIRYSSQACLLDCKEMAIETICGCFESNIRNELYTGYSDRTDALRNCAESTNDFRCATAVTQDFLIGTRTCYCPNACNETIYSRVFSGRLWPSQDYLNELMESACSKYDLDYRSCPLHTLTHAEKSMNFLKINVYYEDLNYQYLSEEPEYELMNLLSDIGGSLGLFLGASALSIGEVFELLVELSCYFVQKRRNR